MRSGNALWITRQLVAAAVEAVELLLDLSLEPDFSDELDLSLDELEFDPLSLVEEPLLELFELLEDSRLSVR